MAALVQWITDNWPVIATCLFLFSEILAYIPGIKSNSVFQAICSWLAQFAPKNPTPPAA